MSRKRRFFIGWIILILAPLSVLGVLAAYAYWDNAHAHPGDLQTRVSPPVILPGGEATYYITYDGNRDDRPAPEPPPIDMLFMVDVSGSMTESLPYMADAAIKVMKELADQRPGQIRFALVRFDVEAHVINEWTANPQDLYAGLQDRSDYLGGNNSREAMARLGEVFNRGRSGARKVAVFYTDGGLSICSGCPNLMSDEEIVAECEKYRKGGIEIYTVGLPGGGTSGLVYQMTGDPRRVYNPSTINDLVVNFRSLATSLAPGDRLGFLVHKLDGRHFSAPLAGTDWASDGSETLALNVGKLPDKPALYAHPLKGHVAGLWRVGIEAPRLTAEGTSAGTPETLRAEHRPLVLVITWWMLPFLLVPGLIWTLLHIPLPQAQVGPVESPTSRELPRLRQPTQLPPLPAGPESITPPLPTLFVGIGGEGLRALQATRSDLKQAHLGRGGQPYRFLHLDLDVKESEDPAVFDPWNDYLIKQVKAPDEVRATHAFLPEPGQTPDHLKWFDRAAYYHVTREELNLSSGAKGDRGLARLALFKWLECGLLSTLASAYEELMNLPSDDDTHQVIVFASSDGGTGSGWFLDIARLLRRVAQGRRSEDVIAPEIIGIISENQEPEAEGNRRALEMEIETALLTGAFPQRLTYGHGDGQLDSTDTESPYNWIFKVSGQGLALSAQAGSLAAAMVDRRPRTALLASATTIDRSHLVAVATHSLHVTPTLPYESVRQDFLLRVLGPDVLLGQAMAESDAQAHLEKWASKEPAGSALQLLLQTAANPSTFPALAETLSRGGITPSQLGSALADALTRRLRGEADPTQHRWQREMTQANVVAMLRLFARRMTDNIRPMMLSENMQAEYLSLLDHLSALTLSIAEEINSWVEELGQEVQKLFGRQADTVRRRASLTKCHERIYLDEEITPDEVSQWTRKSLEQWLGTQDTVSPLQERLFFAIIAEDERARVVLRSYIAGAQDFCDAAEAVTALDVYAKALARMMPRLKLEGRLAGLLPAQRGALASALLDLDTAPRRVLIVSPDATQPDEQQAVTSFADAIPQPPNHGLREDRAGNDHASLRRIELAVNPQIPTWRGKKIFIEAAEQAAEALRLRAEKLYQIQVPPFPPQLRIALAQPDRFLSFARAYKAGHIHQVLDAAGAEQWAWRETGEPLTFGARRSLADAAAHYVWFVGASVQIAAEMSGDFTKLEAWQVNRFFPDNDTLTQIAIAALE